MGKIVSSSPNEEIINLEPQQVQTFTVSTDKKARIEFFVNYESKKYKENVTHLEIPIKFDAGTYDVEALAYFDDPAIDTDGAYWTVKVGKKTCEQCFKLVDRNGNPLSGEIEYTTPSGDTTISVGNSGNACITCPSGESITAKAYYYKQDDTLDTSKPIIKTAQTCTANPVQFVFSTTATDNINWKTISLVALGSAAILGIVYRK